MAGQSENIATMGRVLLDAFGEHLDRCAEGRDGLNIVEMRTALSQVVGASASMVMSIACAITMDAAKLTGLRELCVSSFAMGLDGIIADIPRLVAQANAEMAEEQANAERH
ncbi:hypothetical protein CHELA1G11_12898 [Hyphomicrobiales bacterium]|nr:hypothetical protein CHELA1G2_11412 [Hyphomicrobiales bacterium]CAH1667892.1 hypothetical protein CHELA1G11_12898 [Hyphomicrobiales bacterium]